MIEPRLFLCSGAEQPSDTEGRHLVSLDVAGPDPNVNLKIQDVARLFYKHLSPRNLDLLELASYVYTADAGTRRSQQWEADAVEPWQRDLKFIIPVRDVSFWTSSDVSSALNRSLSFLTTDRWSFEFVPMRRETVAEQYLDIGDESWPFRDMPRVTMFSGGLDSLAGAVQAARAGERLVLVSHRPVTTISRRQRDLYLALRKGFPNIQMLHVPVWINKAGRFGYEPSQRTRSFLFSALGTVVAGLVGAGEVSFFENGVVTLNLPVADEVLRARASRTTHPLALRHLAQFSSLVSGKELRINNPFVYKTKAEVVASIADAGMGHLIGLSVSCAHTMHKSKAQQHCGTCSQCIDRRVGVLAAGLGHFDPENDYVSDVFTGLRKEGYERNIAIHYARHATELNRMSSEQFATRFNLDVTRAVRGEPDTTTAAERIYELHERHSDGVLRVLAQQMEAHAKQLVSGSLEPSSMLALIAGRHHNYPLWHAYADKLGSILQTGLPKACASHPPKNEPHLQELADAILATQDEELIREFPFMRWSSSSTKPDWSKESFALWIEAKFVRKKQDILPITEAIAADITKYGDNQRRVLFVVYDPTHAVLDDRQFSSPIVARENMRVYFIR